MYVEKDLTTFIDFVWTEIVQFRCDIYYYCTHKLHTSFYTCMSEYARVECVWGVRVSVCVSPAGYHADSIPLNYYNGLVMVLTEWLRVRRDQEQTRGQCAAYRFHNLWVRWVYSTIKANVKSFICYSCSA